MIEMLRPVDHQQKISVSKRRKNRGFGCISACFTRESEQSEFVVWVLVEPSLEGQQGSS
jgi:hypothetical protein